MTPDDELKVEISASPIRQAFAVGAVGALGVILIYMGMTTVTASIAINVSIILLGLLAVFSAFRVYNTRGTVIILDRRGLSTGNGFQLCRLDNVDRIETGFAAFKPSNGFLVVAKEKEAFAWSPGHYWRIGRRVGIGGLIPRDQTKLMADMMALMLRGN